MSREPALTYEGALRILGRQDHKWLERLDTLLGGTILTAGVASFGAPAAVAPAFAALLAWIEPKNEAVTLLRKAVDALPNRLRGAAGVERRELIIAAHSTIVVAAYFDALQDTIGHKRYKLLDITGQEQNLLAAGTTSILYSSEIPAPSSRYGFTENLEKVSDWLVELDLRVRRFISGLAAHEARDPAFFVSAALERYEFFFIHLAAAVPEFRIWAELTEHTATRTRLAVHDQAHEQAREEALGTLHEQSATLARVESILLRANPTISSPVATDLRASVNAANRAALDETIIPESAAQHYGSHLVFPKVRQMFVNPRYRLGTADVDSWLADDHRWETLPVRNDLDLRLIAHITSAEAAHSPMLVLGEPGAGKSMLTRVLAARLPPSGYTVVRVPLRHVGAHSPVFDQIQDALNRVTHRRVAWHELVEQSLDTVRVVILDGLDELLHQAQSGLYGYLRAVQEFQRTELAQGRPVIAIITSRTLVADRVDVPTGTPVIKIEEFDDTQIADWLDVWNTVNTAGIAAGTTRALDLKIALAQRGLTGQPLLLMMLAIYVADPRVPAIDEKISPTELYDRILTHFAEREAAKSPNALRPDEVRDDVENQLRQLSIAALGMLNRGRQDISAEELGTDLAVLERVEGDAAETGHRVLSKFFFVYVAESRSMKPNSPHRRFEFLHATFGEYLVARLVVDELVEIARAAFSSRRGVREPEDDLLFALLSFEALSSRHPVLTFAREMSAGLAPEDRDRIVEVLTTLLAGYRDRHGSDKFQDYRPRPVDRIRELAAYTVNVVLLLVAIHPKECVRLQDLFPSNFTHEIHGPWQSMLFLWQSGLDPESYNSVLSILANDQDRLRLTDSPQTFGRVTAHLTALLAGDRYMATVVRHGKAFVDDGFDVRPGDNWSEVTGPWLAHALARWSPGSFSSITTPIPDDADPALVSEFCERLAMLLKLRVNEMDTDQAADFIRILVKYQRFDPITLASAVVAHPGLLETISGLRDANLYSTPAAKLMLTAALTAPVGDAALNELRREIRRFSPLGKISKQTLGAVRDLIEAFAASEPPHRRPNHISFDGVAWKDSGADET